MSEVPDLPTPTVDGRDVYPTCFDPGTWFASKLTDDDPPRKIPRAPWAYPDRPDRYVGHDDPDAWTDFETASEWTAKLPGFGLANRVPDVDADEARPVFFDFDDVRDPDRDDDSPSACVVGYTRCHDSRSDICRTPSCHSQVMADSGTVALCRHCRKLYLGVSS